MSDPSQKARSLGDYGDHQWEQIALAVGLNAAAVSPHKHSFEAAALWYRLDLSRPNRRPPSGLQRDAEKISKAAQRLLEVIGVPRPDDAADGPDFTILELLSSFGGLNEDEIIRATERVGRLAEILQGIQATFQISQAAARAVGETVRAGALYAPKGHRGNDPINDWINAMIPVYKAITGREPGTSVGVLKREGEEGGPLLRFLEAASQPLDIHCSPASWRSRVRRVLKARSKKI